MISFMSRRGQYWDNAPAEFFWATLKRETLPTNDCFESRAEAQRQVRDWLLYYKNEYYAQLLTATWLVFLWDSKFRFQHSVPVACSPQVVALHSISVRQANGLLSASLISLLPP